MGAYGCEEDARDGGVSKGAAGREGVGGATCGGGDDTAVGLDDGEEVGVAVEFEVGDVGAGAPVEDELIKDFELGGFD